VSSNRHPYRDFHRANDPNNGANHLVVAFSANVETGVWELDLRLLEDGSRLPIEVHAWTVADQRPSRFPGALPTDSISTINGLGCGNSTIVVGAYNPLDPCDKLDVSSEGPTRDGKLKPEVSAPGVGIRVAQATSLPSPTHFFDATSAAAPHVTGLIALLMQSAKVPLFIEEIREFVIHTARDDPPSPEHGWDTCYGNGRVDAVAAIRALRHQQSLAHFPTDVVSPIVSAADLNNESDGPVEVEEVGLAVAREFQPITSDGRESL
jgi:subtilisin family serine protease